MMGGRWRVSYGAKGHFWERRKERKKKSCFGLTMHLLRSLLFAFFPPSPTPSLFSFGFWPCFPSPHIAPGPDGPIGTKIGRNWRRLDSSIDGGDSFYFGSFALSRGEENEFIIERESVGREMNSSCPSMVQFLLPPEMVVRVFSSFFFVYRNSKYYFKINLAFLPFQILIIDIALPLTAIVSLAIG